MLRCVPILSILGLCLIAGRASGTAARPITLERIAKTYKLSHRQTDDRLELVGRGRALIFMRGSRRCHYNGMLLWLNAAPRTAGARWELSIADARNLVIPLLAPEAALRDAGRRTIVLDPGHGGSDPGARGNGVVEKEATFDICRRIRACLRKPAQTVHLTRYADTSLPLADRTHRAAAWNADLFVSIHLNATPTNPDARGIESYILSHPGYPSTAGGAPDDTLYAGNAHDNRSILLAARIHQALRQATRAPDRGIRHARFEVLRNAPCPAVLIECGFVSHAAEAAKLADPAYRQTIAEAIASGITAYLDAARAATPAR